MSTSYSVPEEALRQVLISNASFDLTEETCGLSIDSIMQGMINAGTRYACLLNYAGTTKTPRETYNTGIASQGKGNKFVMRTFCILFIRYMGDPDEMEATTRGAIDAVHALLEDDRRLGGAVPFSDVISIDAPEAYTVNDVTFYMLGFTVEMWSKT